VQLTTPERYQPPDRHGGPLARPTLHNVAGNVVQRGIAAAAAPTPRSS
jgi:hypothetical protein